MNSRFLRTLCLVILTIWAGPACKAQMDSVVYYAGDSRIDRKAVGELRLDIDASIFLRDNEYKSRLVKGYTLPGMRLNPSVSYQPLKNLKVDLGVYMIHYWGTNSYPKANFSSIEGIAGQHTTKAFHYVPTFRANLQFTRNANLILGTLYGKSAHRLAVPIYNDENNIVADPETGVQLLWHPSWMHLDAWVDWQSFIYKEDRKQERFAFGLSSRFLPSRREARVQWYLPLQLIMQHHGGEINSEASDRTIKTWLNAAAGAGFEMPLKTRLNTSVNAEVTGLYFSQQAGEILPLSKGWGIMAKVQARVEDFGITAGYLFNHDFVSIYGNPLFGSLSTSYKSVTYHHPSVVWARAEYAKNLGRGFSWGIHADYFHQWQKGYNDPESQLENPPRATDNFAIGIVFRMNPSFLLKKFLLP